MDMEQGRLRNAILFTTCDDLKQVTQSLGASLSFTVKYILEAGPWWLIPVVLVTW
jgi:hypothetical protein